MRNIKCIIITMLAVFLLVPALLSASAEGEQTCPSCGYKENQADWNFCIMCGTSLHVHTWQEATCTQPKTCTSCGETIGKALDHNWTFATCTEAKKCTRCGTISGTARGHNWKNATCKQPKICSICNAHDGDIDSSAHSYQNGICALCGKKKIQAGDKVTFGRYRQSEYAENDDGIVWIVAKIENDQALLVSQYGLHCMPFSESGECDYTRSSVRKWLIYDFYPEAFNETEKRQIRETQVDRNRALLLPSLMWTCSKCGHSENKNIWKFCNLCGAAVNNSDRSAENPSRDLVFLLSVEEVMDIYNKGIFKYKERGCDPTAFAALGDFNAAGTWTRSSQENYVWTFDTYGDSLLPPTDICGLVRPAVWINQDAF